MKTFVYLLFLLFAAQIAFADTAVTKLEAKNDSKVSGTVKFTEKDGETVVEVDIHGLPPKTKHGFHVHQYGDCTAADATSAGGHFNPHGAAHAGPEASERHVGDLGNIESDMNGDVKVSFKDKHLTLKGGDSIIGRAVVLHQDTDDLKSQPSGAAGARIACGVIGYTTNS